MAFYYSLVVLFEFGLSVRSFFLTKPKSTGPTRTYEELANGYKSKITSSRRMFNFSSGYMYRENSTARTCLVFITIVISNCIH